MRNIHNSPLKAEADFYKEYLKLMDEEAETQVKIKTAKADMEKKVITQYPKLSIEEIKTIVTEKKWMAEMAKRINAEMDNISHRLTQRIKELAERYETPLPQLSREVDALTATVEGHLKKMKFEW